MAEYQEELVVFDKKNHCNLSDGEYELMLREKSSSSKTTIRQKEPTWEDMPSYFVESDSSFNQRPSLKFLLTWSDNNCLKRYSEYCNEEETEPSSNDMDSNTNKSDQDPKPSNTRKRNNDSNNNNSTSNNIHSRSNGNNSTKNNSNPCDNTNSTSSLFADRTDDSNDVNSNEKPAMLLNGNLNKHSTSRIIYRFIYNNDLSQQTETSDNFNCPWCNLDCLHLYSLLKHLKLCHSRFNFKYTPTDRCVCIDVSINERFNGSPHDPFILTRDCPTRRNTETHILVCHPKRTKQSLSEFSNISSDDENDLFNEGDGVYTSGHHRMYYHSQTCLPLMAKEFDDDSEEELDPEWLRNKTQNMLDDFTDVNEGEKAIMQMWNLHVMHHNYLAEKQIPSACYAFIEAYGAEIIEKNLYRNFVLHLSNFVDYGLIPGDSFYKLVQKMQSMFTPKGREVTSKAYEARVDYWTKYGKNKK